MKIVLILFILFNAQFLIAQKHNDTAFNLNGLRLDRVKERNQKIVIYADSINLYSGGKIPNFLINECFDLQSYLWQGFHSPISLRWKILGKVNNKKALKRLLDSNDKRLLSICNYEKGTNPEIVVPLIGKSFYELIWKRYKQL